MSAKLKHGLGPRRRNVRPRPEARQPSDAGSYDPAAPALTGAKDGSSAGHASATGSYDPAPRALSDPEGASEPTLATADDVLDVADVTQLLRIGRNTVYELVARNAIPHRRLGKQIRFSRAGIMRWLSSWSLQDAKEGQ
jgi:excisionase family DNA binding protein